MTAAICDPRVLLHIHLHDRTIATEIAAKSLRKAQTAIREIGADHIALVLQGHLVAGDRVAEAGLRAQPRSPKAPCPAASKNDDGAISSKVAALHFRERCDFGWNWPIHMRTIGGGHEG